MREFADHGVLFDAGRAADVRAIVEGPGFATARFGTGNDDIYHKEPILNFETRTALFGPLHDKRLYERYRDVEGRLLGDEREKRFAPEDLCLYLVAHERKHYDLSGTGLRSLLDVYVHLKTEELDMRYVAAEAEKLGIGEFEERNRSLAMRLFGDAALVDTNEGMLSYMVDSGTFGTMEHNVDNQIARHSRAGYLLRRAFPSLQAMKALYPVLGNAPALLPACWVTRLASAVVTKPEKVAYQLRAPIRPGAHPIGTSPNLGPDGHPGKSKLAGPSYQLMPNPILLSPHF